MPRTRLKEIIYSVIAECQETCSKQAQYLRIKWFQRGLNPQPLI